MELKWSLMRTGNLEYNIVQLNIFLSQCFSPALGQGWRVGFLGLLHLDVFTQRLLQEYKAEAILTAPSVPYKIK